VKERKRAQELVREEPEVARELGVGRPELPNAESMGVVDVNHASAEAMARVTGLDHDAVERIVATREEVRGFSSAEDLGHLLDLDPGVVERLRNVTVYVPR
jgi:DNA uptake protein ComE-like DNA-binding protein